MDNPTVYSKVEVRDLREASGFALWGRMGMTEAQKTHYNNPDNLKKFKCLHCPQEMQFLSKFSKHVKNAHMGFTYGCGDCGKTFSSESALNTHKKSVNYCGGGRYVYMYKCQDCDKSFTTPHSRAVHANTLVNDQCPGQRMKANRLARNAARNDKLNDDKAHKRKTAFDSAEEELASARADLNKKSRVWSRQLVKTDLNDINQLRHQDDLPPSYHAYIVAKDVLADAKGEQSVIKTCIANDTSAVVKKAHARQRRRRAGL